MASCEKGVLSCDVSENATPGQITPKRSPDYNEQETKVKSLGETAHTEQPQGPGVELGIMSLPATEGMESHVDTDFSVFSIPQKRVIILFGSFIGLLSPMSGSIYYPALNSVCVTHVKPHETAASLTIFEDRD